MKMKIDSNNSTVVLTVDTKQWVSSLLPEAKLQLKEVLKQTLIVGQTKDTNPFGISQTLLEEMGYLNELTREDTVSLLKVLEYRISEEILIEERINTYVCLNTESIKKMQELFKLLDSTESKRTFVLSEIDGMYDLSDKEQVYPVQVARKGEFGGAFKLLKHLSNNPSITRTKVEELLNTTNAPDINKRIADINSRFQKHMHELNKLIINKPTGGYQINPIFTLRPE